MIKSKQIKTFIFVLSTSVLLASCSTNKVATSDSIAKQSVAEAAKSHFTPEQAIEQAEEKLLTAKKQDLVFFSPLHLKQAEESINLAKEYINSPPDDMKNAPLMSAIAARQYIENAYKNKEKVEKHLHKSLQHLKALDQINASSHAADRYIEVKGSFSEIIKTIEQGNVKEAKHNESDLIKEMISVEISTLKSIHLDEAIKFFQKASDLDAEDLIEITFTKAETELRGAEKFIEGNFRDRNGVKQAGENALQTSKKAYYTALETKNALNMNSETAEKHTLATMDLLNKIHIAAKGEDIVPNSFSEQSNQIIKAIRELKTQTSNATTKQNEFELAKSTAIVKNQTAPNEQIETHDSTELKNAKSTTVNFSFNEDEQEFDSIEYRSDLDEDINN